MNRARAADLLEANEHLVLAVIRAQEEADRAVRMLRTMDQLPRLDVFVGGPDDGLLCDRLARALSAARQAGSRLGLLFVSLDNLASINDALGHALGEQVFHLAAARLLGAVRGSDTVSRVGDHQFLVLLTAPSRVSDAIDVARAAVATLTLPMQIADRDVRLQVHIGVSMFPDDGDDADALLDRATAAMYHARRVGQACFVFEGEAGTNARSLELRQAEAPQQVGPAAEGIGAQPLLDLHAEVNQQLVLAALRAQELLAAAERAQREQASFMGVVAHELRGPLGPLSNAAALLEHANPGGRATRTVRAIIDRQVSHLGRLVSDLLDVARFNTGKLHLDVRRLDLQEVLADVCEAVGPAVAARQQTLHTIGVGAGRIMVNGDRVRLTQVMRNLLDNATKYTPEGGVLQLSVQRGEGSVTVCVADNGIGIARDALPTVFDRHVQEGRAITFDPSGLGIGLALVRELVVAHGGQVTAQSGGPGLGSRFEVTLPLLPARN